MLSERLAVARQIEREAERFGFDASVVRDQSEISNRTNVPMSRISAPTAVLTPVELPVARRTLRCPETGIGGDYEDAANQAQPPGPVSSCSPGSLPAARRSMRRATGAPGEVGCSRPTGRGAQGRHREPRCCGSSPPTARTRGQRRSTTSVDCICRGCRSCEGRAGGRT